MAASSNGSLEPGSAGGAGSAANMKAPEMTADGQTRNSSAGPEGKPSEYLRELMDEKHKLDSSQWPNAARLLDQEVAKAHTQGGKAIKETKYVDIYREKPIKVSVKVLVPSKEHPKFNFVGKLLGPKGNSLKRLQEETMTKMAVLGRGSMKDRTKEEECRNSLDPKYSHLSDDLHVEISAMAPPAEAHARIAFALAEIRKYMVPDSNDEIRQEQFREMEMYSPEGNGVRGGPGARGGPRGRGGMMRGVPPARFPPPPMRGGAVSRGGALLSPPHPRAPQPAPLRPPPPQALLPRPLPGKTKVLSILDRARVAMEESYSSPYDDDPSAGFYDGAGYGGYDDYDDAANFYSASAGFTDTTNRWKGYKAAAGSVTRFAPRSTPYSRPPK
ncbi:KH domain-containing, RNA-binding, signal transduction-associated protein 3 isoform X4 [Frankliniella occidentalis]|uniref:KH domain-containing, RNA-binding, signal transduction-associated protein 3 isoform X3 n=1 Tax=Frankliniella occidentalis TaxID=133901 RepID=A0A9C6XTH3_FRAOC|nr:KH domain-containing, RNA-binding, signal transduction-associated protein 3 isoform X3 [Frankliniella occidentalis]XP_052130495.1 KH domain-containing, RNA-binding, signal transduction-associated protein 3 isoform X3 [Frankliniella occidentalis]XP_052130498.1 KH domain-containing, RNA-binding, signal transduction-associated protein 3 isoform X4 [Frankliniella occidentalis]